MNWTHFIPSYIAALLLCVLFHTQTALAEPEPEVIEIERGVNIIEEELVIGIEKEEEEGEEGEPAETIEYTFNPSIPELEDLLLQAIVIKEGGTLTIDSGTEVHLAKGGTISIEKDGTIKLLTSGNTSFSTDNPDDAEEPGDVLFILEGGTIEIRESSGSELTDDKIIILLRPDGGIVDVDTALIFESGGIYDATQNQPAGDLMKIGAGTWKTETVSMRGTLDVLDGTFEILPGTAVSRIGKLNVGEFDDEAETVITSGIVNFFSGAEIGTLNLIAGEVKLFGGTNYTLDVLYSEAETLIDGLNDAEKKSNLAVLDGGAVKGNLLNISRFIVGDGYSKEALTLEGEQYSMEEITINPNAILGFLPGTTVQIGSEDGAEVAIYGKLTISTASTVYKGDIDEPETLHFTLGFTDSSENMLAGTLEIIKEDTTSADIETFTSDIDIELLGEGRIIVHSGVVFEGGNVFGSNGLLRISGGGTFQANEVSLENATIWLEKSNAGETTMNVSGDAFIAGRLIIEENTKMITDSDAEFILVEIAGLYDGDGNDLTIKRNGWIGGKITGIDTLTLEDNGYLYLDIGNDGLPIIEAENFVVGDNTRIRISGGTSGRYDNVIRINNGEDDAMAQALLGALNNSGTALYRPDWTISEGSFVFNLDLSILSVNQYVRNEWGKKGQNVDNVSKLIDDVSVRYPTLRQRLEGFTEPELKALIRHAMAGELVGNALRLAMHQPANTIFRHLDTVDTLNPSFGNAQRTRGQVREGFNLWFNAYGQAENASRDHHTFDGYDISRYGFYLGSDVELYRRAVAGVLFGYSNPYLKSSLGKVSADDFTAGLYIRVPTAWDVMLNGTVGFGSQSYRYRHPSGNAAFGGSSLFASAELSRAFSFSPYIRPGDLPASPFARLTPLIALDFQTASMDGLTVHNAMLGGMRIEPENLNATSLRFGLLGEFARFRTRLQYIRQIAGDDCVSTATSFLEDAQSASAAVRSMRWGKDWLNTGVSYEIFSNRHWRLIADYNFDVGRQTTSHLGSINAALKW